MEVCLDHYCEAYDKKAETAQATGDRYSLPTSEDAADTCRKEIEAGTGPLTEHCGKGCTPTETMVTATCADAGTETEKEDKSAPVFDGPCSEGCETFFIFSCLKHHCDLAKEHQDDKEAEDGLVVCTRELERRKGPLVDECKKGCEWTEKMKASSCDMDYEEIKEDEDAIAFDGPCEEKCERSFIDGCLTHHCQFPTAVHGGGLKVCTNELEQRTGPMVKQCKKGCTWTDKMKASSCADVDSEQQNYDDGPPPDDGKNHEHEDFENNDRLAEKHKRAALDGTEDVSTHDEGRHDEL